jgi:hypothetical protein
MVSASSPSTSHPGRIPRRRCPRKRPRRGLGEEVLLLQPAQGGPQEGLSGAALEADLDEATIAHFQRELGAMSYKFQFVTLAGFHAINYSMFELAQGYRGYGLA